MYKKEDHENMKCYKKLIFVDSSDTTRSPMAEIMLKKKLLLSSLVIESRGLIVLFPEPINQKSEAILISHGYEAENHMSKPLIQEDIGDGEGVLILAMEQELKEKILEEYSNLKHLYTLTGFVGGRGDLAPLYGEPLKEYGYYYETLDTLLDGLVIKLNEEEILS